MTTFYTTQEVAEERKISKDRVLRLARRLGLGESHGGRAGYRFTREDINKMFAATRQETVIRRSRRRSA